MTHKQAALEAWEEAKAKREITPQLNGTIATLLIVLSLALAGILTLHNTNARSAAPLGYCGSTATTRWPPRHIYDIRERNTTCSASRHMAAWVGLRNARWNGFVCRITFSGFTHGQVHCIARGGKRVGYRVN